MSIFMVTARVLVRDVIVRGMSPVRMINTVIGSGAPIAGIHSVHIVEKIGRIYYMFIQIRLGVFSLSRIFIVEGKNRFCS